MLVKKFQAKLQNHTCETTKDLIMRFIPNSETIAPVNDSEAPVVTVDTLFLWTKTRQDSIESDGCSVVWREKRSFLQKSQKNVVWENDQDWTLWF